MSRWLPFRRGECDGCGRSNGDCGPDRGVMLWVEVGGKHFLCESCVEQRTGQKPKARTAEDVGADAA